VVLFDAVLAFVQCRAGLTPGAVLLPAVARLVHGVQDGERAHLRQAIRGISQGSLQRAKRPGRRAICLEQRAAPQFLLDASPFR
jgi:hypothetical protein